MQLLEVHDKTAILWKEKEISYKELFDNIYGFSNLYKINPERVAIYFENRPEWIYSFYSGWLKNATMVPIDHLSTPEEVNFILEDCKPEVIFTSNANEKALNDAVNNLSYNIEIINVDKITVSPASGDYKFPQKEKDQTAVIIYTSGTTGTPKGVMLSFENLWVNMKAVSQDIPIYQKHRNVLILLPLHHTFPLVGSMIMPLSIGSTVAMAPSLNSDDILNTLAKGKVNIIIGVPRFYSMIHKGIMSKINKSPVTKALFKLVELSNSKALSKKIFKKVHDRFGGHVEYMVSGGAALDYNVGKDYRTLGFEILEGYGMTECAPMITFTRPGRRKLGSAGEILPGCEVKIVDGEITVRGANVMQGYFNRPEETAEVIKDGWLYTGDLGEFDNEGFLFITGRKKEIIVLSNGKNVNPVEIELKFETTSEYIKEMGVFNSNDQLYAVIYPDFAKLSADGVHNIEEYYTSIIDRYNMNVSSYKKIAKFFIVKEELPKTRLGKIRRFMLEDLVNSEKKKSVDEEFVETEEFVIIRDYLKELTGKEVFPTDHLEIDLGLDSLDKVNLLAFVKSTFGVEIDENILAENSVLEKFAEYISENKKKISLGNIDWKSILNEKIDIKLPSTWLTHHFIKYATRALFSVYFRFTAKGVENLPKEPCIIAPNHQSFFDGLFLISLLKNFHLKNTYFYAKEKHMRGKLKKFIASKHNVIVMDINKDLKESLQKMAAALKKGKNIIIFPEGTRTKDGKLGSFKKTFAILSKELNVPVVPVTIKGAFDALPTGSKLPKPFSEISVIFDKPVFPGNNSYEDITNMVVESISEKLNKSSFA